MNIIINKLLYRLIIIFILNTFYSSCIKDKNSSKPCKNVRYTFEITGEFYPQKENYLVGDTIFFNSIFEKKLKDLISNNLIDYSENLGIYLSMNFSIFDTITKSTIRSLNKFSISSLLGSHLAYTSNSINVGISTKYISLDKFYYKNAIILKEKGIFLIAALDGGSQGLIEKDCTNAGFSLTVTNTNKNLNLFEYSMGYMPDSIQIKNMYCFRVQ